ncbi:MAG: transglutaminase-like domain-containing protein [Candidatus Hydrogenedentes bacterium]|nr:transglutaminase-like domain-containing protein [Candidatus Hydrogenedentota bacterium]
MKKVILLMVMAFFPRLLVAQDTGIDALLGEHWYGLYLKGQKCGYSMHRVDRMPDGVISIVEDAQFKVLMGTIPQDLRIYTEHKYSADGALMNITARVDDPVNSTTFHAAIDDDKMILSTSIGGDEATETLPRPKESLDDALKQLEFFSGGPKKGDTLAYSMFDPVNRTELNMLAKVVNIEERILDGTPTTVYKVNTTISPLGFETTSFVAEDGTLLEDTVPPLLVQRLEPKEIAQDVEYSNDTMVSNAALVDEPIENPRDRDSLRLVLTGPLTEKHLFNDERQFLIQNGDGVDFTATRIAMDNFTPAALPIAEPDVAQWKEATAFVQSDNEKLQAKAKEIIGGETDALKISNKLCKWVYQNVHSTFSARLSNALEVLENLEGDCTEHSILFIGLARAAGLPAREVAGLVYVDSPQPGFYFHQWAKVWVGKWIDVDPTFNQPLADVTHIKLAEGDLLEQTKFIPLIGQINVRVVPQKAPEGEERDNT